MNGNISISSEVTLVENYTNEIEEFWLSNGKFSSFLGLDSKRINFAIFTHCDNQKNIVIVQGRSESYLKYKETIFDLFNQGFNVFIHDHRGQGLSERLLTNPYKGYVDSFDDYVHDLQLFISLYVLPSCHQKKPYLLAHSMGGAISALYLAKYSNFIHSSVFLAPMFAINTGILPISLARTIINLTYKVEGLMVNKKGYFFGQSDHRTRSFKGNSLTHSPVRYEIYKVLYATEQAIQLGGVTTHWLKEAHRIIDKILTQITTINHSILVLQAGNDSVIDNKAQNIFYEHLSKSNDEKRNSLIVIENAKHELLFEEDQYRNQTIHHILTWFK